MRTGKNLSFSTIVVCLAVFAISGISMQQACADYLKMNPPPDVDKAEHGDSKKESCWVASASNLLAGAGYGDGNNVQERADDIYDEICSNLCDCNNSGWDDTAMQKWMQSNYNTWKNTNPYTVINKYGAFGTSDETQRFPYARTDLPQLIGNDLRGSTFLSLSIRRPTCDANVGIGGHSIACWGDDGADANYIDSNPAKVKVSDSDYWNTHEPVQTYTYDDYNNPNPNDTADCNEGVGWYIDYANKPHWYIDGFVTLEPTADGNNSNVRTLVTSAQFTYNGNDPCALDLHYSFSSNHQILSYRTTIDWDTNNLPSFFEDTNNVSVSWDLSDNPVPKGSTVTITVEIVVPYDANGNSVSIGFVLWTPMMATPLPGAGMFGQHFGMPGGPNINIPNMCGGYVICACSLYASSSGPPIGEYRWQFRYSYYEDPCNHLLIFQPVPGPGTYFMGNFRFGHSHALLMDDELPHFSNWKTVQYQYPPYQTLGPKTFTLNWTGTLPYPKGQDYIGPQNCGDPGTQYADGDLNKDCTVDLEDLKIFTEQWLQPAGSANLDNINGIDFFDYAILAENWLQCTDPNQANCP